MIPTALSGKQITDLTKRGAWATEHGVVKGLSAADQAANLDYVLDSVVMPVGGKDLGILYLPPGPIKLETTWLMAGRRDVTIVGTGRGLHNTAVLTHGGSANLGGTHFYWDGVDAAGACLKIDQCNFLNLQNFSICLDESTSAANQATHGIHFTRPNPGDGNGRHFLGHIAIHSHVHGGIGVQTSEGETDLNCDTSTFLDVECRNLATGFYHVSEQNMEWTHLSPKFQNTDTYWHFVKAGNMYAFGIQAQDARPNVDIVFVKVDRSAIAQGHYVLVGGYIDAVASGQFVSLFETHADCVNTRCIATGINVRLLGGTTTQLYDGTERGYIEASGGCYYELNACVLMSQPVVRWGASNFNAHHAHVQVNGCTLPNKRFGTQLVQCNAGGFAGSVAFNHCQMQATDTQRTRFETVTVNEFPIAGSSVTHWDIDDFDGSEYTNAEIAATRTRWTNSWLGGGQADSPAWAANLLAYYRMNEPLEATSLVDMVDYDDLSGGAVQPPANDLTIDSVQQAANPPIPHLDTWCDWSKSVANNGRDTGINIDPSAGQSLGLFFFMQIDRTVTAGMKVGALVPASGSNFQIGRIVDTLGNISHVSPAGTQSFMATFSSRRPAFVVWTFDAATDTAKCFVNGTLVETRTTVGYAALGVCDLWIGGDETGLNRWKGKLGRFGIIHNYLLSNKEATLLSLAASVCAKRNRWTPE